MRTAELMSLLGSILACKWGTTKIPQPLRRSSTRIDVMGPRLHCFRHVDRLGGSLSLPDSLPHKSSDGLHHNDED